MIATILTTDQIRNCEGREYNPQVWEANIYSMVNEYKDVVFYHVPKGDGYEYDRYFVEYTLPEGLRLFGSFSYSGGITSGGFYRLDKTQITADGKTFADVMNLMKEHKYDEASELSQEIGTSQRYEISYGKFYNQATGDMVMIGTSKEARAWMTERSMKYDMVFTKG